MTAKKEAVMLAKKKLMIYLAPSIVARLDAARLAELAKGTARRDASVSFLVSEAVRKTYPRP